jgi:hypothetical protein
MSHPFFSVAIPTKGRSFLVGNAVESVLRQGFSDFEIILVDNDDGDATHQAVSRFSDKRLRYCRTGNLSMPDNWEHACRQARGEYLLLLEDKQALHAHALDRLHQLINQHHPPCLKWKADTMDDLSGTTWVEEAGGSGEARFISSEEVLRTFLSGTMSEAWNFLPIGHLSAFSRQLRDAILAGPVGRLCPPVSPDYTLGIQSMAFGEGVLYVDEALVAMSRRHSNGRSLALKTALGKQFMAELGGAHRFWSRTPIQAPIIPSSLFNDYLELQAAIGGRLGKVPFDWMNYYVETWCFLIGLDNDGVPVADDLQAFETALAKEPAELQKKVWMAIEEREGPPSKILRKNRRKALRRRTGLLAVERAWKTFTRRITGRRHIGKFQNPLEFVIWFQEQKKHAG